MNTAIVVRLMIKNLIRYILKSLYRILKMFEDLKSAFNLILKKVDFRILLNIFSFYVSILKICIFFLNFEPYLKQKYKCAHEFLF